MMKKKETKINICKAIIKPIKFRPGEKVLRIHGICQCKSCIKIRKKNEKNIIFMDPPYYGIKNIYNTKQWKEIDYVKLRNNFHEMSCLGFQVILSMSDEPLIRELFKGYNIKKLSSYSAVTHKKVKELVITNMPDEMLKKSMKKLP